MWAKDEKIKIISIFCLMHEVRNVGIYTKWRYHPHIFFHSSVTTNKDRKTLCMCQSSITPSLKYPVYFQSNKNYIQVLLWLISQWHKVIFYLLGMQPWIKQVKSCPYWAYILVEGDINKWVRVCPISLEKNTKYY